MSDREEQLKADIRDLQKRLAVAQKPAEIVKHIDVPVVKYVDRVKVETVQQVVYKPCRKQAARIAELEAEVSRLERECLAR